VKDIQLLVATKAFGMAINLPDIRHIFNVGVPEKRDV
jgi:superfamily II DNA helicase RecQ